METNRPAEPAPPSDDLEIPGDVLLNELVAFVRRFVVMTDAQASAVAVWVLHTHALDAAAITPYLAVTSAEKRSGKSKLLDVLALLCAKPWRAVQPSEAVVFRKIDRDEPTLLLDEVDAIFGPASSQNTEGLRALLNAGFQRGTTVPRCVGQGQQLREFATYCPKVLAGIGNLPDTVSDRCVPIRLKRKASGETCERFRLRRVQPLADALRERAEAWGREHIEELRQAEPELPDELDDRGQDVVEPLVAIADLAGGRWPDQAREALVELRGSEAAEDESLGIRLLGDVRAVFDTPRCDRLPTQDLLSALHVIDDAPWGDWHGKPLTGRSLAWLLKGYGVKPQQLRFNAQQTCKGYQRGDFEDSWRRYLPKEGQ